MVIVDDHITLLVLAGALDAAEVGDEVATTSLWYLRLVAAATAPPTPSSGPGRLRRILDAQADRGAAMDRILHPPRRDIEVLHPMDFALHTARAQRERRLNLLAAETVGAASHHRASVLVAAANAGGPIEAATLAEGIEYRVLRS